jgi:hypothetical protein
MIEMTRDFDARESIERCWSEVISGRSGIGRAATDGESVRLDLIDGMHRMIASCRGSEGSV